MKLHQDDISDQNVITGYGDDHVTINGEAHHGHLIVMPDRIQHDWAPAGFEGLADTHVAVLADLGVEIVLIGTGRRQRFPSPQILRPLIDAGIGMEIMDVAAACRTYNILVGENRSVAAALLFDIA
ncbi:Xcc1710-like domain-containing protein [Nitrogeniibacter mangrovi]|uniref:Xcc1710-like domain-containing protein n=1 Tax=Nitrogeniibacter mangrovi TaxID=2016596 RepID=A0A6C1B5Y7_9RHOO|nr:Mth938-like domain-containing protein [Nitrogeniibacter mangrovi]QID18118.1 Xcc1710-like domain-containing protein [Nitrogeniibacter mangrovi]